MGHICSECVLEAQARDTEGQGPVFLLTDEDEGGEKTTDFITPIKLATLKILYHLKSLFISDIISKWVKVSCGKTEVRLEELYDHIVKKYPTNRKVLPILILSNKSINSKCSQVADDSSEPASLHSFVA